MLVAHDMLSRKTVLQIHLIIASLFLPLLLLMPLTGSLYLWGFSGTQEKTEAFRFAGSIPTEPEAQERFFREQFKAQGLDFDFEYIRSNKNDFVFRPTSRVHYSASLENNEIIVSKIEPSLLKRLSELHKGHGPVMMRWFESLFGIALILTTLSGLWLAISVPAYRKASLISFAVGTLIIAVCLI